MIERISQNEERLDKIEDNIKTLEQALLTFKNNQKELLLLQKYYGSKNWFKDKEAYEKNKIPKIKAGVLSEDEVWNMLLDIDELLINMKRIIAEYERIK